MRVRGRRSCARRLRLAHRHHGRTARRTEGDVAPYRPRRDAPGRLGLPQRSPPHEAFRLPRPRHRCGRSCLSGADRRRRSKRLRFETGLPFRPAAIGFDIDRHGALHCRARHRHLGEDPSKGKRAGRRDGPSPRRIRSSRLRFWRPRPLRRPAIPDDGVAHRARHLRARRGGPYDGSGRRLGCGGRGSHHARRPGPPPAGV